MLLGSMLVIFRIFSSSRERKFLELPFLLLLVCLLVMACLFSSKVWLTRKLDSGVCTSPVVTTIVFGAASQDIVLKSIFCYLPCKYAWYCSMNLLVLMKMSLNADTLTANLFVINWIVFDMFTPTENPDAIRRLTSGWVREYFLSLSTTSDFTQWQLNG